MGIVKQKKHLKYHYPSDNIIINSISQFLMKYIIIGLGNYGHVLAEELATLGHEIIGADNIESRVDSIKDKIATAFVIDATA